MYEFMTTCGANVGRGSYASAFDIEGVVLETREALASLFGAPDARDIVFTRNVTESLNLLIKGLLHEGDHVIVSSMEHNAVMRPLVQLESRSVSFTRCPCDETGMLDIDALAGCLRPNTRAVVMLHASNVTVVQKGSEHPDEFNAQAFVPGAVCLAAGLLILFVFYRLRERRR